MKTREEVTRELNDLNDKFWMASRRALELANQGQDVSARIWRDKAESLRGMVMAFDWVLDD